MNAIVDSGAFLDRATKGDTCRRKDRGDRGNIDREPEPPATDEGWPKRGRFFADYDAALRESDADIVYLSLPNAMHEAWALAALASGRHVLVDKPAMITREACERAVAEARRGGRLLAEATVFGYHPHFDALKAFIGENGPLTHVDAQFIIPPLPIANFRNHGELGGGCLLDMGPYAAALMRMLGGGLPSQITALGGTFHPETGVDMGFSPQARLLNGAVFSGHFSFEGEYQKSLAHRGAFRLCNGRARVQPARRLQDRVATARP